MPDEQAEDGGPREKAVDEATLRMYWESQWRRNQEHEGQRLQFSNFVVAASVVAIGVAASALQSVGLLVVLAVAVVAANAIAIWYSYRSGQWARVHKHRADIVLSDNWPYLERVQKRAYVEERDDRPLTPLPHPHDSRTRREILQRLLHVVLIVSAASLPIVAAAGGSDRTEIEVPAGAEVVGIVLGTTTTTTTTTVTTTTTTTMTTTTSP